eukprot:3336349-Pyramimonas_sp.AAC.1
MPLANVYASLSRRRLLVESPTLLLPRIAQGLGTSPGKLTGQERQGWWRMACRAQARQAQ